ncbi:MAG: ATP-binding protein [Actinomycetota bacterium]
MFDNLSLRSTMLATAAVPVGVLGLVALWSALSGGVAVAVACVMGAVVTAVVAVRQSRRLTERVATVAESARRLTDSELPALLDEASRPAARSSDQPDDDLDVNAAASERSTTSLLWPDDELTAVMEAITGVTPAVSGLLDRRRAVIDGNLRRVVERLTRRTESLLNEQLAYIDWLEDTEQQPDRLQQLYRLDHLTNRARRSTESVLVLAEAAADRPRSEPSPIDTVVRVAIGETSAYSRIKLAAIDPAWVAAEASFDLAHLLAELLENATGHTADGAEVEVFAVRLATGDYRITVVDHGPGMAELELTSANVLLADPPRFSIEHGATIGLTVIARLARRLDAIVDLTATPGGGVTAVVTVPGDALASAPSADAAAADGAATADRRRGATADADPETPTDRDRPARPPTEGRSHADTSVEAPVAVATGPRRRQRSAASRPLDLAPRLEASDHDPAEVQAVISRYRDGLEAEVAGADSPGRERR